MRVPALLLIGALVGALVGGATGAFVATSLDRPAPGGPLPLPTAPRSEEEDAGLVADVARDLSPSVVTVINRLPDGQQQSAGSGFLVDARHIVTNSHVVSNVAGPGAGASFEVIFTDDRRVDARLVGRDEETDVAVLEVPPQDVPALVLGDSNEIPIGATVVAIGSALGEFRNSVTSGVISGKARRLQSESDPNIFLEDLVQTDAAISPGNSGGPLIWAEARQVVGMNTLVLRPRGSEGLGFAISSNTVRTIADEIIRSGRVERGRIGIAYQPLTSRQALALGLDASVSGALITEVLPGTPAEPAGLRSGDVITRVYDQEIDAEHPLATIMLRYRPGDVVGLTIVRDGTEQLVEVTLGRE